jgi:phage baseplate assembly protein W
MSISIKFPFKETQQGGVFMPNNTTLEAIQTNLIALLTLKRRNRVMHNNLYSPLWDYIFEPWDDISSTTLKSELIQKISEYIPQVEVTEVKFNFDETKNLLEVKIVYKVTELGGLTDDVSVVIPVEPGSDTQDTSNF